MDTTNESEDPLRNEMRTVSLQGTKLEDVDVDGVWHFLGPHGKYQVVQMLLLFVCHIGMGLPIVHGIFVGKFVDFNCTDTAATFNGHPLPLNQTECRVQVVDNVTSRELHGETCTRHDYGGGDSIVSYIAEWDLVCDKEVLGQLPQILLLVGQGFGASLIPPVGDRFGRKKLVMANVLGLFLVMLVSAFVQQFEFFLVLRFFIGAFLQGICVAVGTMMLEGIPLDVRQWLGLVQSFSWASAFISAGILGYVLRDAGWRTLQLTYALFCGIPSIIALFFLDESLRWLVGNSRIPETMAILQKACRWNHKDYQMLVNKITTDTTKEEAPTSELIIDHHDNKKNSGKTYSDPTKPTAKCRMIDLVSHKNARTITFVMCYTWFTTSLTYYAIILMSTSLAGDPYVNFFLAVLLEIPGGIVGFYFLKRLDRKHMLIGFNLAAAGALLLVVLIANVAPSGNEAFKFLQTCFTLIGQFFVIQIFVCIWVYTPELYPTNLRNVGLGITSSMARFGASFSPLFTLLARKIPWVPGALFGGGCLLCAFLALTLLPETRRVALPVTLQDVDNLFHKENTPYSSLAGDGDHKNDDAR